MVYVAVYSRTPSSNWTLRGRRDARPGKLKTFLSAIYIYRARARVCVLTVDLGEGWKRKTRRGRVVCPGRRNTHDALKEYAKSLDSSYRYLNERTIENRDFKYIRIGKRSLRNLCLHNMTLQRRRNIISTKS